MVKVENIKVAVRVRPFNTREKAKGCRKTISMIDRATFVSDPTNKLLPARQFSFDYSYWSHDGYRLTEDGHYVPESGVKYIDQKRLFADLGTGLLDNAWSGYNCTLFAYGQTGSGKTYSMMGYGPNKGLIPTLCETLFEDISAKGRKEGVIYKVSFSMFEIYNEKVFDLLNKGNQPKQGLPVRQNQKKGFYVEGLLDIPVSSFDDIEYYIEECNKNRTTAVTNMNETSSRAHTIVTISFLQNYLKENRTKSSKINMVDLAGSERASQTRATGIRFEESKTINKSLMTLGQVIKNLCATATGRDDQGPTPYRDSKLTMLLKDAIGGNCKTIMVATLSPSDQDFEQTLSTLRYADRVKSIKNTVKMNVSPTDKLVKELLAEKEALLNKLKEKLGPQSDYTEEEIKTLKEKQLSEIQQIKNEMANVEEAWQRRLQETKRHMEEELAKEKKEEKERSEIPHMWNLNEDPVLSGKVYHLIRPVTSTTVGNARALNPPDIILHGPSIAKEHCVFQNKTSQVSVCPLQGSVRVNGVYIKSQTALKHHDRLFFGANNLFVFHHPLEERHRKKLSKGVQQVTYELAKEEIRKHTEVISEGQEWLKDELSEILGHTCEANAMAQELDKGIRFDPVIVPTAVIGPDRSRTSQVYIRVSTNENGEFLWGRDHFLDRFELMMVMFQQYESGDRNWEPTLRTQDPFWEPLDTPTLIGVSYVPLESIAYMLDIDEQKIGIYDYQARHVGYLCVSLVPCEDCGDENSEDLAVEEPIDLIGKSIQFKIKIRGALGIPKRYKSSWCHYMLYNEMTRRYTDELLGAGPTFNYEQMHEFINIDHKGIEYLQNCSLMIELHGRQSASIGPRRQSLLDAYTISDRRRISTVPGLSDDGKSLYAFSSLGGSSYPASCASSARLSANSVILETDESEVDYNEADETSEIEDNAIKGSEGDYEEENSGVRQDSPCNTEFSAPQNSDNKQRTDDADLPDILRESSRAGPRQSYSVRSISRAGRRQSYNVRSISRDESPQSDVMEEMRFGISCIMKEVIEREGLANDESDDTMNADSQMRHADKRTRAVKTQE